MIMYKLIDSTSVRTFEDLLEEYVNNGWDLIDVVLDPKMYIALLCMEDDEDGTSGN